MPLWTKVAEVEESWCSWGTTRGPLYTPRTSLAATLSRLSIRGKSAYVYKCSPCNHTRVARVWGLYGDVAARVGWGTRALFLLTFTAVVKGLEEGRNSEGGVGGGTMSFQHVTVCIYS